MAIYDEIIAAAKQYPILYNKNISNGPNYVDLEKKAFEEIAITVGEKLNILINGKNLNLNYLNQLHIKIYQ